MSEGEGGKVVETVDLAKLDEMIGDEVAVSDWVTIEQEQVNDFAEVTGDHQWIHVDVERSQKESPFGGPIAHGFLVLSLGPMLSMRSLAMTGVAMGVNYGLDKVRFLQPVPVGSRIRLRIAIGEVRDAPQGKLVALDQTFELEGADRPACVARQLVLYFPAQ